MNLSVLADQSGWADQGGRVVDPIPVALEKSHDGVKIEGSAGLEDLGHLVAVEGDRGVTSLLFGIERIPGE